MRIFLIKPPTGVLDGQILLEPIGLSYIGAVCRQAGHRVEICDLLNVELADIGELFRRLDAFAPEVVGFTSMTENHDYGVAIARAIKGRYGATVIFGGWHVGGEPASVMEPSIDYVVLGEGEDTILELLDYLEGKGPRLEDIQGIAYKVGDSYRVNERRTRIKKITSIPLPLREGLPFEYYKMPTLFSQPITRMRTLSVQASRGCPYTCFFCQTPPLWGNLWTKRTASDVVDEIEQLIEVYGANTLWFRDEEFTIRTSWVVKLCEEMIRRGVPKRLSWGALCRPDDFTPELAQAMSEAGFSYGFLGIESGSQELREKMGKRYKQEEAERALELFDQYDITSHIGWIIGFPWDTRETIERPFEWLLTLKADILALAFAVPFAGTQLRQEVEDAGLLSPQIPNSAFNTRVPVIETPGIPRKELLALANDLTRRFYLRPRYLARLARRMLRQPKRVRVLAEAAAWAVFQNGSFSRRHSEQPETFDIPSRYFEPVAQPQVLGSTL